MDNNFKVNTMVRIVLSLILPIIIFIETPDKFYIGLIAGALIYYVYPSLLIVVDDIFGCKLGSYDTPKAGKNDIFKWVVSFFDNNHPLIKAATNGNETQVIDELNKGADVDTLSKNGETALLIASYNGYENIARILCDHGADIGIQFAGGDALIISSMMGHADIVRVLLQKGADVNASYAHGETLLMAASQDKGNIEVVRLLLDNGAKVNTKEMGKGRSALMFSIANEHLDITKLLIANNADIKILAFDGTTTLMIASMAGMTEIVPLLIEKGLDVNAQDTEDGYTALLYASLQGNADIVDLLLSQNADSNLPSFTGTTALMNASIYGHVKVVQLLLKKEADVRVIDHKYKQTALEFAIANENTDIVKLLEPYSES